MAGKHYGQHTFKANVAVEGDFNLPGLPNNENKTLFLRTNENGLTELADPGLGIIDITYLDFVIAREESELIPGRWYRMTDFQTCHMIVEITPGGLVTTAEENVGAIEPLLLFAHKADDYLHTQVYSTISGDRMHYSVSGSNPQLPEGSVFKGVIHRRIVDERNISMPLDWQTVIWKMAGAYYQAFNGDVDPENPFEPRYGASRDIYIGQSEYNAARPTIFVSDNTVYDLHVGTADICVVRNLNRCRLITANIVNINLSGFTLNNAVLRNFDGSYVITTIAPITLNYVTANGADINVSDVGSGNENSFSFLYRDSANEIRTLKVDTSTDTLVIAEPTP